MSSKVVQRPRLMTKVAWETRDSTMMYMEEISMEQKPSSQRRPYSFSRQHYPVSVHGTTPLSSSSSNTKQLSLPALGPNKQALLSSSASSSSPSSLSPSSASSSASSSQQQQHSTHMAFSQQTSPASAAASASISAPSQHSAGRVRTERATAWAAAREPVALSSSSSSDSEDEDEVELGSSAYQRAYTTRTNPGVIEYRALCKQFHCVPVTDYERVMRDKEVVINSHGLGPHGARAMAASLVNSATVERIELRDNDIRAAGAQAFVNTLGENQYITHVDLSSNNLASEGINAFARAIVKGDIPKLHSLVLNRNNFLDMDATAICAALKVRNELTLLHLSGNKLGDVAAARFGDMLKVNEGLISLDLSWNCIRARGGAAIGDGLAANRTLEELNLSHNGIGDAAMVAVAAALQGPNAHLRSLNLAKCDIHDKGAGLLAAMIRSNTSLRAIDISNNPISGSGMRLLLEAIAANPNITDFNIEGNALSDEVHGLLRALGDKRPDLQMKSDAPSAAGSEHDRLKGKLKDLTMKYAPKRPSMAASSHRSRRASSFAIELDARGIPVRRWPSEAYDTEWTDEEKWVRGYNADGTIRSDIGWLTGETEPYNPSWPKQVAWEAGYNPDGSVRTDPEFKKKKDGHRVSYKPTVTIVEGDEEAAEEEAEAQDKVAKLKSLNKLERLSSRRFSELYPTLVDPMEVLDNYVSANNLRLVDLFFEIDRDRSGFVTMDEAKTSIQMLGLDLNEIQLNELMFRLDLDGDGQLNYFEFAEGRRVMQERRRSRDPNWTTRYSQSSVDSMHGGDPEALTYPHQRRTLSRNSSSRSLHLSRPASTEPRF